MNSCEPLNAQHAKVHTNSRPTQRFPRLILSLSGTCALQHLVLSTTIAFSVLEFMGSLTERDVLETYTKSNYGHSSIHTAKTAWFQRQNFLLNNYA